MTRISSEQFFRQSIGAITQRQAQIGDIQQQISSGQRILRPSDDPVAASQAEQTRSDISRAETERRMVNFARNKLQQAEGAIGSGIDGLQSARDILLAANNDTNGPGERMMFAQQLRGLSDELFTIANRSDGLGAYVFGGVGTREPPFSKYTGQVLYVADSGEQLTGSRHQYSTSIDGRAVFESSVGMTGTPESVFDTLERTIDLLEDETVSSADLHAGLLAGIDGLDRSQDVFSATRARLGEQLAAAERTSEALDSIELGARARLSDLADTDFAEAISELMRHQTGLEAAMQTYAQISGLSLFNYVR